MKYDHNNELRRQIKEREERGRLFKREALEEERKIKQQQDINKRKLEMIKLEKLNE
jgi:hypothetical protein